MHILVRAMVAFAVTGVVSSAGAQGTAAEPTAPPAKPDDPAAQTAPLPAPVPTPVPAPAAASTSAAAPEPQVATPSARPESFSNVPVASFVNPYQAGTDYPEGSVLGVYDRGLVHGVRPGFVLRIAYLPSVSSGEFDGSKTSLSFVSPLAMTFGLGGRLRLSPKVTLTLEADIGADVLSIAGVSNFDANEAAKLGVRLDARSSADQIGSSQKAAMALMGLSLGPAMALEVGVANALALYARPKLAWTLGPPFLQRGTQSGTIKEPDGFLDDRGYVMRALSLEGGLVFVGLRRSFTLGAGLRAATYSLKDLPDLGTSGFYLALGTTT